MSSTFRKKDDAENDDSFSGLLIRMLEILGFSSEQIKFNKYSYNFPYYVHRLLLPDIDHPIYVGSIAEGLWPGTFYRGEKSDTDAILTFFEEFNVVQNEILSPKAEMTSLLQNPGQVVSAINDSKFPGYVKLKVPDGKPFYLNSILFEVKAGFFPNTQFRRVAVRRSKADDEDLDHDTSNAYDFNGPSVTENYFNSFYKSSAEGPSLIRDNVPCLIYRHWPNLADKWIHRKKKNRWLDEKIVNLVVSQQCLLAPVGHHDCAESDFQWRISFRGEDLIFEQLNTTQLYCYIVLKIILKDDLRQRLPDNYRTILSSYCIKNLIFWCVETEKINWSLDNLVVCVKACLSRLKTYLEKMNLPHYLLQSRNLFNSKLTLDLSKKLQNAIEKYMKDVRNVIHLRSFDYVRELPRQNNQLELYTEVSIINRYCLQKIEKLYFHYSQTNLFG